MKKNIGIFKTEKASRYLQQLCKHFAHKVAVEFDKKNGRAEFPPGPATFTADDEQLTIEVTAENDQGLLRARNIIDSHMVRFAHKENYKMMDWSEE